MYNHCILSVLPYSAKKLKRKLRTKRHAMEQKIIGITFRGTKTVQWTREQTRVSNSSADITRKKMDQGSILNEVR